MKNKSKFYIKFSIYLLILISLFSNLLDLGAVNANTSQISEIINPPPVFVRHDETGYASFIGADMSGGVRIYNTDFTGANLTDANLSGAGTFDPNDGSAFKAADVLTKVFGISSLSPAFETSSSFNDLIDECLNLAGILLHKGNTFAVRCKRVGSHNYSSDDVRKEIGKYILDN